MTKEPKRFDPEKALVFSYLIIGVITLFIVGYMVMDFIQGDWR